MALSLSLKEKKNVTDLVERITVFLKSLYERRDLLANGSRKKGVEKYFSRAFGATEKGDEMAREWEFIGGGGRGRMDEMGACEYFSLLD